jgi:energy-converting hydrogenase Eha subunit F
MDKDRHEPGILELLERAFEQTRKRVKPIYPYDRTTNAIRLPRHGKKDFPQLGLRGSKVEAVKRVAYLTGAGLRISKDYVDQLATKH